MLSNKNLILQEIADAISVIEYNTAQIDQRLLVVEKDLQQLFSNVNDCQSMNKANEIFALLSEYHEALSKLVFKHGYNVSDRLRTFVRDFERVDDIDVRKAIFRKIQNGEYGL